MKLIALLTKSDFSLGPTLDSELQGTRAPRRSRGVTLLPHQGMHRTSIKAWTSQYKTLIRRLSESGVVKRLKTMIQYRAKNCRRIWFDQVRYGHSLRNSHHVTATYSVRVRYKTYFSLSHSFKNFVFHFTYVLLFGTGFLARAPGAVQ